MQKREEGREEQRQRGRRERERRGSHGYTVFGFLSWHAGSARQVGGGASRCCLHRNGLSGEHCPHAHLLQAWNVWRWCSYNTHLRFEPIFQVNDIALLLLDRPSTMRPLLHLPPGEAGSGAGGHWIGCTRAH